MISEMCSPRGQSLDIAHPEVRVSCVLLSRTLEDRAKRLFMTKGVPLGALDASLFAKSKSSVQEAEKQKEIAQLEALIYKYSELLGVSVHNDIHRGCV